MAGYSATPLAKKLGIKQGHVLGLVDQPEGFVALLEPLPENVVINHGVDGRRDVVVAFFLERASKVPIEAGRSISRSATLGTALGGRILRCRRRWQRHR